MKHFKVNGVRASSSKLIKATDLSLPECNCQSPPWEECEHTRNVEIQDAYRLREILEEEFRKMRLCAEGL